ncbi:MAG: YjbF family lipoprotein [Amaricoccus sp.]|uniref:YjbF family lipoprotein n=1 Tax=Amaricoccus sp. TaxID=1872485 RepID=UPI0039E47FB2
MIRRSLALAALALLAGCGSQKDPVLSEAMGALEGMWRTQPAATPQRQVTRADIERSNVAAILARLETDQRGTVLYASADNGGYVTYVSPLLQQVTLKGAEITATRGLGTDLLSGWSSSNDPLVRQTPPAAWPARVDRTYELPSEGPRGRVERYTCTFQPGAVTDMVILQVRYSGLEMSETCTGADGSFENLHFVDPTTGAVRRSLQWVGPRVGHIDMQVLEPYTP